MWKLCFVFPGTVEGPPKIQPVVDKNRAILESFVKAMEELAILRENLLKKEVNFADYLFVTFVIWYRPPGWGGGGQFLFVYGPGLGGLGMGVVLLTYHMFSLLSG